MVRLASNTAALVTTIIPVSGTSGKCGNRLLMKTLFVTVVNHRTRTVITKEGDRLYPSGNRSRYLLIPQDGIRRIVQPRNSHCGENLLGPLLHKRHLQPYLRLPIPDIHTGNNGKHVHHEILSSQQILDIHKLDHLFIYQAE